MKLTLKNVGALGPGTFTANFNSGITAILGPNGTGKSTLVNALYFAITGESINSVNLSDLITWGCHDMSVTLEDSDWSITRSLVKGMSVKASFKRGKVELFKKAEIDEALLGLFGLIDKSAYKQVYFSMQFNAIDLLERPDSERLAMLSTLFGFGRLEKAREALQRQSNMLFTSKIDDTLMQSLKEAVVNSETRKKDLVERYNAFLSEVLPKETVADFLKIKNAKSEDEKLELECRRDMAYSDMMELSDKLESFKVSEVAQQDSLSYSEAKKLREYLPKLDAAFDEMQRFDKPVVPSSSQISDLLRNAAIERSRIDSQIKELRSRETLVKGGKCPLTNDSPCFALVSMTNPENIKKDIDALSEQLKSISADEEALKSMLNTQLKAEKDRDVVRERYNTLANIVAPLRKYSEFDVEGYEKAQEKASIETAKKAELTEKFGSAKQLFTDLDNQLKELKNGVVATKDQIERVTVALDRSAQAEASANALVPELKQADEAISAAKVNLNRALEQNRKADEGIYIQNIFNKVRTVLHKDNLPRLLIDGAKDVINKRLHQVLTKFEFKYDVNWLSGGKLTYTNEIGEQEAVSLLSGGQKYVVCTALRCALADLLHSTFPFILLDEPTTGLDAENRELMSDVLYKLSTSGIVSKVIVPTHDSYLLSNAEVINVGE